MTSDSLRDAFRAFTTTCALITTDGPHGPNAMAAEWTFNVSYHPFLVLVSIDPGNLTHDMILESKEFGVNLVADDQIAAMGFAGHYSKTDTDKLSSELFETYPAQHIRAPMIRGALLNAECRLVAHHPMGDHTAFVGEVVGFSVDPAKTPVVLNHGSHRIGERIVRQPGLVVAVTPMRAKPGEGLLVTGELTGPDRAGRDVAIRLQGPNGDSYAAAKASTDEDGSFRVPITPPGGGHAGRCLLVAESDGLEGHARVDLVS